MKYYNFFKFKPVCILMLIFICLSIVHIIFATMIERGLVLDGAIWMPKILEQISDNGWGFEPVFERTRCFINIINQLPLNIAYHLGIHSRVGLCRFFSLPLFLFPFLITLWNIYLTKRTKRYDIALLGLFIYGALILPAIMLAVVETYLASTLIVLFYHYLVSDIKFNKTDIFIIFLLSIVLLYSTEIMIFAGPMFFIYVLFVTLRKNQSKEKIIKILMGLFAVAACIIQRYFNRTAIFANNEVTNDLNDLLSGLSSLKNIFQQPYIIEFILFLLIIFALLYKKKIGLFVFINMGILYAIVFKYFLYCPNYSLFSYNYTSYKFYIIIFMPVIFFFVCLQDIFKKYLPKQKIYNLYILILAVCIINTSIQLSYSTNILNIQKEFNNLVTNSTKTFLKPEEDLVNIFYAGNNNFLGRDYPPLAILLYNDSYKINKFILPNLNEEINDNFKIIEFHPEKNVFYTVFYTLPIKNKFWDLSDIAAEFNNNRQYAETYRIKDPEWLPDDQ